MRIGESHGLRLLYTVKVVYVRVQSVWLRALQANAETWQGICKFHFIFRWNSLEVARRNDLYLSLSKHITSFLFLSLLFFWLALALAFLNCVCGSQQKPAVKDFMNIRLCDPLALLHEANTNRLRQKKQPRQTPQKRNSKWWNLSFPPPFHICLDNGVHCVGASTFWFQMKSNVRLCVLFLNNQLYLFYHS